MNKNEAFATFWKHLEELRRTLLHVLLVIVSATAISFFCYVPLISLLKNPLILSNEKQFHEERLEYIRIYNAEPVAKIVTLPIGSLFSIDLSTRVEPAGEQSYLLAPESSLVYARTAAVYPQLVILGPLEGLLISLKSSLWIGTFASSPLWLLLVTQFFLPGLRSHEKRLILPFILTSITFILMGSLFAYWVTIPIANRYLASFNETIGTNLWSLGNYLDYTLFLLMANGLAFELGAVGVFAVHLQYLTAEGLTANRRIAILMIFVISAILTPPDILTQFMLAIPLISLYEAVIIYARLQGRKKTTLSKKQEVLY